MKKQNNETEYGNLLQKPCTSDDFLNSVSITEYNYKYSTATQQM